MIATVTSKGQLTLPVEIRRNLNLKSGDRVCFEADEKGAYTVRKEPADWKKVIGLLSHLGTGQGGPSEDIADAISEAMEAQDLRARAG